MCPEASYNRPVTPPWGRPALALLLGALLLAAGISNKWRIQPDSALYVGIAKSLASGGGYLFSGRPQYSIPPVTPWVYSIALRAGPAATAGADLPEHFLWVNVLSASVAFLGMAAALLLATGISGLRKATLALLLLVLSERYYGTSLVPLTDAPYCLVSWVALAALSRLDDKPRWAWGLIAACSLALAPLTRAVGVPLVLAAAVCLVTRCPDPQRRRAGLRHVSIVIAGLAAAAAFLYLVWTHRSGPDFNYLTDLFGGRTAWQVITRAAHNVGSVPGGLFEAVVGLESIAGMSVAFLALVAWGAVRLWRMGHRLPVLYMVLYLAWVTAGEEFLPRYGAPLLPLVYLFAIEAVDSIARYFRAKSERAANRIMVAARVAIAMLIAANLVYIGRQICLNFSRDFYLSYSHGKYKDYLDLCRGLAASPPGGLVMARQERVIGAVTGLNTIQLPYTLELPWRPDSGYIDDFLRVNGVGAIVVDGDPKQADDAGVLRDYLKSVPNWKELAQFGRLVVYSLEESRAESASIGQ